jgi:hypothetical protein
MKAVFVFLVAALLGSGAAAAPDTTSFMNVLTFCLTICGASIHPSIEANLQGSITSLYEKESTASRAAQDIVPQVLDIIKVDSSYRKVYTDCILQFLSK